MDKNRNDLLTEVGNLIHENNGMAFVKEHKENLLDYRIQDNKLYFYSELFYQWIYDDLNTWTINELRLFINNVGRKNL